MKRILLALVLGFFLASFATEAVVFAQNQAGTFNPEEVFPTWDGQNGGQKVEGVIGNNTDNKILMNYVPAVINILLKFVSPIIAIVLIIAGVRMIVAGDDSEAVEKSKNVIKYCTVGIVLILLSYSIMRAVYFFFVG